MSVVRAFSCVETLTTSSVLNYGSAPVAYINVHVVDETPSCISSGYTGQSVRHLAKKIDEP